MYKSCEDAPPKLHNGFFVLLAPHKSCLLISHWQSYLLQLKLMEKELTQSLPSKTTTGV